jgi:hypothetical protein
MRQLLRLLKLWLLELRMWLQHLLPPVALLPEEPDRLVRSVRWRADPDVLRLRLQPWLRLWVELWLCVELRLRGCRSELCGPGCSELLGSGCPELRLRVELRMQ